MLSTAFAKILCGLGPHKTTPGTCNNIVSGLRCHWPSSIAAFLYVQAARIIRDGPGMEAIGRPLVQRRFFQTHPQKVEGGLDEAFRHQPCPERHTSPDWSAHPGPSPGFRETNRCHWAGASDPAPGHLHFHLLIHVKPQRSMYCRKAKRIQA